MKRALLLVVLITGCAAQRAEKSAPSTAPAKYSDQDGTADGPAPSTMPPPPGSDTSKVPSTTAAPTSTMPGGGGATGTIVVSEELSKAQISFEDASKSFTAAGSDCAQLCKALHSMTHATDRLCELTQGGSLADQQRCTDARVRLDAAKAKVKSSCGTC